MLQPQNLGKEICGEQQGLTKTWISMSYGFFDFVKSVYLVKAVWFCCSTVRHGTLTSYSKIKKIVYYWETRVLFVFHYAQFRPNEVKRLFLLCFSEGNIAPHVSVRATDCDGLYLSETRLQSYENKMALPTRATVMSTQIITGPSICLQRAVLRGS